MSPERPTPGLGLLAPDIDMQAACVAACVRASTVCSVTADACLDEDGVADLRAAIRLLLDCVDVLTATATVLSRHFGALPVPVGTLLSACADLSATCADEIERSVPIEHGQRCMDECRRAADACDALLEATVSARPARRRR
jgi:hypothetical protein